MKEFVYLPGSLAALIQEQTQKTELQKQINDINNGQGTKEAKAVPRPKGSAGTNFSIQEAMGLAGSAKKYEMYKALQVCQHAALTTITDESGSAIFAT